MSERKHIFPLVGVLVPFFSLVVVYVLDNAYGWSARWYLLSVALALPFSVYMLYEKLRENHKETIMKSRIIIPVLSGILFGGITLVLFWAAHLLFGWDTVLLWISPPVWLFATLIVGVFWKLYLERAGVLRKIHWGE